jgi:hypothetical protein
MQLKARLWALIRDLPAEDPVRSYGEQQLALLDKLAAGTTRGPCRPGEPAHDDPAWSVLPSHPDHGGLPD